MDAPVSSTPRGILLLPFSVALYLACCLFAALYLFKTGSGALFWPAHLLFAVLFVTSLLQRGTIGALLAGIVRAGSVFVALAAFMAYFLVRCIFTPYEQLGSYYAKIGISNLGLGVVLGFCLVYPLLSLGRSVAKAGLLLNVVALTLITIFIGANMRQDIFLIDLLPQNASYYQIFSDYLIMFFACCVLFIHAAKLGNGMPTRGFITRQVCSACLAIWAVLVAQGAGSNNAGATITLMSAFYFMLDTVDTARSYDGKRRAWLLVSSLGGAIFIAVVVASLIAVLPPLRIFNFDAVSTSIVSSARQEPNTVLNVPTSVLARVENLDFFWQQFAIDPVWGHLGAELIIGKPGGFPHSLLSVQSHLGAVGSIMLLLFLGLAVARPNFRRFDTPLPAITVAILLIGLAATFFTWMPFWFLAGLLLGTAAINRPRVQSGTHLHVSMTAFQNESRVLKETMSLVQEGLAQRVVILALHEGGLPKCEGIGEDRVLHRLALRTRNLPTNLLAQMLKYVELAWAVYRVARRENVDVISVHTIALLPIGALVKAGLGTRLVYDAHELETETHGRSGLRQALARMLERSMIAAADLTIVVSPGIENWYRRTYGLKNIITVLNAPERSTKLPSNRIREATGVGTDRTVLLYQGALVSGRGIDHLLTAAPALADRGYDLVFMGYGSMRARIEGVAAIQSNVHFLPAVAPAEVMAYTSSADIGLCSIEDSCLSYRLSLPNKLFEYLFSGLPVIASDLPDMARILQLHRVGTVVDRWEAEDILGALKTIDALRDATLTVRLDEVAALYGWSRQKANMAAAYELFLPADRTASAGT